MPLLPRQTFVHIACGVLVPWYFFQAPMEIVRAYRAYAWAFLEIFSFPFLLRTLLSPWKNLTDAYPRNGLNLGAVMQTLTLNCMSRLIGCMFRLVMMAMGVTVHIGCLMLFAAGLALWLAFPILLVSGLGYVLASLLA